MTVLSHQQLTEFERNGILRVGGAIASADIESMTALVWDNLERRYPVRRDHPETWTSRRISGLHALDKSVTFQEIGSAKVCQVLDDLLGSGNWQRPSRWGFLLVAFPESAERWDIPCTSWHLDLPASGSLEELFAVRLFTCLRPLRHRGGATLVVAGSHLLVNDLAPRNAGRRFRSADIREALVRSYPWMRALCWRGETADRIGRFMNVSTAANGAELRVIEMTGEAGDTFLVHPLILHAASPNCADVPRMVLSSFVHRNGVEPGALYQASR
jgi:ectoine hydroxylase-related dioxygenase (phytanoyl-CoA dioxygenase family)